MQSKISSCALYSRILFLYFNTRFITNIFDFFSLNDHKSWNINMYQYSFTGLWILNHGVKSTTYFLFRISSILASIKMCLRRHSHIIHRTSTYLFYLTRTPSNESTTNLSARTYILIIVIIIIIKAIYSRSGI